MSDTNDKTEEPTARKLEKTREEGQFARSQELSVAILTIAVAILLFIIGGTIASNLLEVFEKSFIFLDPPYIASCNNFYSTDTGENIENIYEKLYHKGLKNFKCKILICHENNWLFKILFNDYLDGETEYQKRYNNTIKSKHNKTSHICVKNYLKRST